MEEGKEGQKGGVKESSKKTDWIESRKIWREGREKREIREKERDI